jgi:endoglucanase
MKNPIIKIAILSAVISFTACTPKKIDTKNQAPSPDIRLNQLGYLPVSPKKVVVVASAATKFKLLDSTGNIVFSCKLVDKGVWDLSKEAVKIADFTSFEKPGVYKVYVEDLGASYPFRIDASVYADVSKASVKAFYLQRASMSIEEKYAGKFNHPLAHPDDKCFYHPSSGKTSGTLNSPKGWYDAGDYNKYIVNAGVTVSTMLTFYENYPQAVPDNALNIPESGNGISDLLDEIKYELDWAETMQDADGGVFFKLTSKSFSGFIKPQDDTSERFVVGKSTSSTLNFAAMFAQASRVWKNNDPVLAEKYLAEAKRAWNWAIKNPAVVFRNPDDVSTGEYGHKDFTGDFYWAGAELFATTGEPEYLNYLIANPVSFAFVSGNSWSNYTKNLGYYALLMPDSKLPDAEKASVQKAVLTEADLQLENLEKNPYHEPLSSFVWGSNSDILNLGIIFVQAYRISNDKKYLNAAIETTDYIFGKNALGICFVTGFGSNSVMNPHHRLSVADGITEPIPGWVAGGPNAHLNDAFSERNPSGIKYTSNEPAKAYMDLVESYASNEICINWNGPLVYMTFFIADYADYADGTD